MPLSSLLNELVVFRRALDNYLTSDELLNKITELKKIELSEGKTGSNKAIRPLYSEMPYYKDWYNEWKKKTIPTYKLDDIPDLYIDGTFYSSLYTSYLGGGLFQTASDYSKDFMRDVIAVHDQGDLLDLTKSNTEIIAKDIENFFDRYLNV